MSKTKNPKIALMGIMLACAVLLSVVFIAPAKASAAEPEDVVMAWSDTADMVKKEVAGKQAIATGDGWGGMLKIFKADKNYDAKAIADTNKGAFTFWFHVGDLKTLNRYHRLTAWNLDVCCKVDYTDSNKYSFNLCEVAKELRLGWNKVILPFETAAEKNSMNWSTVRTLRINQDGGNISGGENVVAFADFGFTVTDSTKMIVEEGVKYALELDSAKEIKNLGDVSASIPAYKEIEKDGDNALTIYANNIGGYLASVEFKQSVNVAEINGSTALSVWMYFEAEKDVNKYSYFNLDICSGVPTNQDFEYSDSYKYTFGISSAFSMCKVGWNQIIVPFSVLTAGDKAADMDWSNVRGMRLNVGGSNPVQGGIANLEIIQSKYTELTVVGYVPPVIEKDPVNTYVDCGGDSGLHILGCDEACLGGTLETEEGYHKEGTGAIKFTGCGTSGSAYTFEPTINLDGFKTVTFWLYLDNAANFKSMADGQLELRSDGGSDDNEIHWGLKDLALKDGWNYVRLELENAIVGKVDLKRINYMKIYFVGIPSDKACTAIFDDFHAHKDSVVIESFDTPVNNLPGVVAGRPGSTGNANNASGQGWTNRAPFDDRTVDIAGFDKISFWVYCKDELAAEKIEGTEIELSSSGQCDKDEIAFFLPKGLKVGWQEVIFDVSSGKKTGNPDLTAINFLGFVKTGLPLITVYFDDLTAYDSKYAPESVTPIEKKRVVTCDNVSSGVFDGLTVDNDEFKEGVGALTTAENGYNYTKLNAKFAAVNTGLELSGAHELGLAMWVYISDASKVSAVNVALSSSDTDGKFELQWTKNAGLKDGWNWLTFKASDATRIGGVIDLSDVKRVTVSMTAADETPVPVTIKLDCVMLVDSTIDGAFDEVNEKRELNPINEVRLDNCETAWTGAKTNEADKKQGYASVELSKELNTTASVTASKEVLSGATDLLIQNVRKSNELGVTLWVYVEDVSKLDSVKLNIATDSAGKLEWTLANLKNGWNWVALKATEGVLTGTVNADNIKIVSVTVAGKAAETNYEAFKVLVDRISLVNYAVAANLAEPEDESVTRKPIQEKIIIDCDRTTGTIFNGNKVDKEDFRYSTGCVYTSGNGYALNATDLEIGKTDLTKDTLVLAFWVWIEDPELFKASGANSQVELGSKNNWDEEEIFWDMKIWTKDLKAGWNWVALKGADAEVSGGMPDFDSLKHFRVYVNNVVQSTLKIDRITLGHIGNAKLFDEPDWENEKADSGIFKGPNANAAENSTYIEVDFDNGAESFKVIETVTKTEKTGGCKSEINTRDSLFAIIAIAILLLSVATSAIIKRKRNS